MKRSLFLLCCMLAISTISFSQKLNLDSVEITATINKVIRNHNQFDLKIQIKNISKKEVLVYDMLDWGHTIDVSKNLTLSIQKE